jgi:hypothetical protein
VHNDAESLAGAAAEDVSMTTSSPALRDIRRAEAVSVLAALDGEFELLCRWDSKRDSANTRWKSRSVPSLRERDGIGARLDRWVRRDEDCEEDDVEVESLETLREEVATEKVGKRAAPAEEAFSDEDSAATTHK